MFAGGDRDAVSEILLVVVGDCFGGPGRVGGLDVWGSGLFRWILDCGPRFSSPDGAGSQGLFAEAHFAGL